MRRWRGRYLYCRWGGTVRPTEFSDASVEMALNVHKSTPSRENRQHGSPRLPVVVYYSLFCFFFHFNSLLPLRRTSTSECFVLRRAQSSLLDKSFGRQRTGFGDIRITLGQIDTTTACIGWRGGGGVVVYEDSSRWEFR